MAARIMEARAVISAEDKTAAALRGAANNFQKLATAGKQVTKQLSADMALAQQRVSKFSSEIGKIEGFRALQANMVAARHRFREAQAEVERLGAAMNAAGPKARGLAKEYERAQRAVSTASRAFQEQAAAVKASRSALESAGIPLSGLQRRQEQLARSVQTANAQLSRQAALSKGVAVGSIAAGAAAGGATRTTSGGRSFIGGTAGTVGVMGGGFVAKSAYDRALEFEKSINATQARGELSPGEAAALRRNARNLGAQGLGFTSKQVSELQRAYVQAGYEKQAGAMALPTMRFSLFGDVDPFKAADYTVSALSAFGRKPKTAADAVREATNYQDIIAKGANISRLGVEDFASGFKFAAPFASKLGISMEQLAAMIATQGQAGLRGDEAGIAVRSMLTRAVKPTADSRQAMAEMGLRFEDYQTKTQAFSADAVVNGLRQQGIDARKIKGVIGKTITSTEAGGGDVGTAVTEAVIKGLGIKNIIDRNKVSKMVQRYASSLGESLDIDKLLKDLEEKGATVGQTSRIFDSKQGARLSTLLGEVYQQMLGELRNASGASERGAGIMNQGAVGAHNRLVSSYDNLILSLAESGVMDTVAGVLNSVAGGLRSLAETSPKLLEFGTYATLAAAALGGFNATLGRLLGMLPAGMVPGAGAVVPAIAGGMVGAAIGRGMVAVGQVAAGKYWTPHDDVAASDLERRMAENDTAIAGIRKRTHPSRRGEHNPDIARLETENEDLRNRVNRYRELRAPITRLEGEHDAVVHEQRRLNQLNWRDLPQTPTGGVGSGKASFGLNGPMMPQQPLAPIKQEIRGVVDGKVEGEARVQVKVDVNASPQLQATVAALEAGLAQLRGVLAGSVGSNGASAAEASP